MDHPNYSIRRLFRWDSAHRVLRHESKCATLHGHGYTAEVNVIGPTPDSLDPLGRVIDFGVLKERIGEWIDRLWDHATLVNQFDHDLRDFCEQQQAKGNKPAFLFKGEPTAEAIAAVLLQQAQILLDDTGIIVTHVTVHETPNCQATVWKASHR